MDLEQYFAFLRAVGVSLYYYYLYHNTAQVGKNDNILN